MAAFRTANPALNEKSFRGTAAAGGGVMTIEGTVNKSGLLLVLVLLGAVFGWRNIEYGFGVLGVGLIGGLIAALVTIFKKEWAPWSAPIYGLFEGLFLGGISVLFEMQYPGVVINAVSLTFGTLFCLLLAYRSGLIKATENFKMGVFAATGAIGLIYLVSIVMGFFGASIPMIHSSGPVGIGFSLVVVVIAALNLVLDFDFIEQGAEAGAPKYMEWYAAFGLMVTLVWLYLEMLRLLAKLRGRD